MNEDSLNILKRYRLLLLLVFLLIVLGVGCWWVERRSSAQPNNGKDKLIEKLDERNK